MAGHGGRRPGAGRPKGAVSQAKRDLAEAAREHAEAALQTLREVMADPDTPPSARIAAAVAILDRGHGRPPQGITMVAEHTNPGAAISPRERIEQRLAALSAA